MGGGFRFVSASGFRVFCSLLWVLIAVLVGFALVVFVVCGHVGWCLWISFGFGFCGCCGFGLLGCGFGAWWLVVGFA